MNETYGEDYYALVNATELYYEDLCAYEQPPMTDTRIWLVTVFGTTVALISICENTLLFFLFLSRKHHRNNHDVYLLLLAFFDVFVSVAYICLMSVNVLSDYLVSPTLVNLWYSYTVPVFTVSHIAMTSASFLIIAASFERFCMVTNNGMLRFAQRNRKLISTAAIVLGVISKGSICLEFNVTHHVECEGTMMEYQMSYHPFVFNTPYHIVWRFWYRNFVTIFAPFAILAYLNGRILAELKSTKTLNVCAQLAGNIAMEQARRKIDYFERRALLEQERRKATARAATRTLVMVVSCYLISNIINVLLTIAEHMDRDMLLDKAIVNYYAIVVDMVSLLTNMACAFRLPIYMACQPALREEIFSIFLQMCGRKLKKTSVTEDEQHLMSYGWSSAVLSHSHSEHKQLKIVQQNGNHSSTLPKEELFENGDILAYIANGKETLL